MTPKRALLIGGTTLAVLLVCSSLLAIAVLARTGSSNHPTITPGVSNGLARNVATTDAIGNGSTAQGSAAMPAYAGAFEAGPPPFGQNLAGDGLIVYGVAQKEVADPNAKPDAALVKSAFEDAQKKAQGLASAAGLKLGSLLAITEYSQTQPYFKPCPGPLQGVPETVPQKGVPAPQPAIAPYPCNSNSYVVVWVLTRYQVQS
jgi:hypothetical protein